jgi:hypothetical protein
MTTKLSEKDLTKMRLTLMEHLDKALSEMIESDDIQVGYWPDETVAMMADASITVIKTVAGVNEYMEREELIK